MTEKQKNSKFMRPMKISKELAEIVGAGPLPRTEITKRLWEYIKKNKLQESRNIKPDSLLSEVIGKEPVDMFEMTRRVSSHIIS